MEMFINVYPFFSCFFDPSGNQTTELTVPFEDILTELRQTNKSTESFEI